jgi:hypothetical protein
MVRCDAPRRCLQRAPTRYASASMTDGSPEDARWLARLVERTPLLPDATLRRHWRTLIPWLPKDLRYELAATLLEVEHALEPGSAG